MDLVFESLLVSVSSDDSADLIWLEEFLGPSFQSGVGGDGTALSKRSIRLQADARLYARFTSMLPRARCRIVGFVMDGGPLELETFPDGDSLVAYDPAFAAFYRILHPHAVEVIDAPAEASEYQPRRARGAMMRVVREWAMNRARSSGLLALHAAGIARAGLAMLFVGSKQAGKTSLTAACLLADGQWDLLANDRMILAPRKEAWLCLGMASIVSIRPGSLELVPGLADRLPRAARGAFAGLHEGTRSAGLVDGRLGMSPAQFAAALGTRIIGTARVHAVAFPQIDRNASGIHCRHLARDEATERLRSTLFAAATPHLCSGLFDVPGENSLPCEEAVMGLVADLASQSACVEVRLGRNAYDASAISDLLRSLND